MKETESGLLVPDEPRKHGVMTNDEIRLIRRAAKMAEAQKLTIVLFCQECKEPLVAGLNASGQSSLNCKCKERVVW